MAFPIRKPNRLPYFDYSSPGAYFIPICTVEKKCILSRIVGGGAHDAPSVQLTRAGQIVQKYIDSGNNIPGITVDKFVIMPNHIHMLLFISGTAANRVPSPANAAIPHFVSTLKSFVHRDIGEPIFQRSYHDHVIRGRADYEKIWQYIDHNPFRWKDDCFYAE